MTQHHHLNQRSSKQVLVRMKQVLWERCRVLIQQKPEFDGFWILMVFDEKGLKMK